MRAKLSGMMRCAAVGAAFILTMGFGQAQAATMTNCPTDITSVDRYVELTTDPASTTCIDFGDGNIDNTEPYKTWKNTTLLEKYTSSGASYDNGGALFVSNSDSSLFGSFKLDLTGLKNVFVGFKWGGASGKCTSAVYPGKDCFPDWAVFSLNSADAVVTFDWIFKTATGGSLNGLSHINVYGEACTATDGCGGGGGGPNPVPVPASLPLLLGALGIAGFVSRRRKRA